MNTTHYYFFWIPNSQFVQIISFSFLALISWWIYWMSNHICSNCISFFSHNIIVYLLILMDLLWIKNIQIISFLRSSWNGLIFFWDLSYIKDDNFFEWCSNDYNLHLFIGSSTPIKLQNLVVSINNPPTM